MKAVMHITIWIGFCSFAWGADPNSPGILWNDACPCAFAATPEAGNTLKKEIPVFHSDFRWQLEWQAARKIAEPNETLGKQIILTTKILKEVFKPGIIPLESIENQFLLSSVSPPAGKEQVLLFRVKTGKYIVKFMKRLHTIYITIRPISGTTIDMEKLATDIFSTRILPIKWEKPFGIQWLKRRSRILRAGCWRARDNLRIDSSGNIYRVDHLTKAPEWVPLGQGLYSHVTFYTDGKFAIIAISGGPRERPKPPSEELKDAPGSDAAP